jgi:hypothetical protein
MDTDKLSVIERLEELLNQKDGEIHDLQNELDKIKEGVEWEWAKHQSFDVDPYPGLPCPRLQMRFGAKRCSCLLAAQSRAVEAAMRPYALGSLICPSVTGCISTLTWQPLACPPTSL